MVWVSVLVLASAGTGLGSLSDGLVAYYPFNGNANEASGNPDASDGIEYGGPSYVPGRIGQAIMFDGVDDWVHATCEDIAVEGTQGSFAVSFWLKPTFTWTPDGTYPNGVVVGNVENWVSSDWMIVIGDSTSLGRLEFHLLDAPYPSPSLVLPTLTNTWSAETWSHVVYSHDAATRVFSVWVNGTLEDSVTMPDDVGRNWAGEHISIARYDGQYIAMNFDELRLYSKALSPDEIRSLAIVPVPGAMALAGVGLSVSGWLLRRRRTL